MCHTFQICIFYVIRPYFVLWIDFTLVYYLWVSLNDGSHNNFIILLHTHYQICIEKITKPQYLCIDRTSVGDTRRIIILCTFYCICHRFTYIFNKYSSLKIYVVNYLSFCYLQRHLSSVLELNK